MSRHPGSSSRDFDAEAHLSSLEAIGWKLGLERMNALCDELERPQDRFGTIHVVGTNGKSSVARMIAALLEAHGTRSGCLVSPHLSRWSERVLIGGHELEPARFADAVARTAVAAETVDARIGPGDSVTQFETSVAAGFLALAEAGVEAAAIEAGLGGRLDATNTIRSSVTALTSIGLDHTEWLGQTEVEIAGEKLAVLRPGTALVLGPVAAEVRALAFETAEAKGCEVIEPGAQLPPGVRLPSPALYQRGNFAVAIAAADSYLAGSDGRRGKTQNAADSVEPVTPDAGVRIGSEPVQAAAASAAVPGRLEKVGDSPPVFVDVAHNRPAAAALAASIPEIAAARPVVALIAILDDKDAAGIVTELAPVVDVAIFADLPLEALRDSARPGARGRATAELTRIADRLGLESEACPEPRSGLDRARGIAEDRGGVVLVTGSHFLLPTVDVT